MELCAMRHSAEFHLPTMLHSAEFHLPAMPHAQSSISPLCCIAQSSIFHAMPHSAEFHLPAIRHSAEFHLPTMPHSSEFHLPAMLHSAKFFQKSFICDSAHCHIMWNLSQNCLVLSALCGTAQGVDSVLIYIVGKCFAILYFSFRSTVKCVSLATERYSISALFFQENDKLGPLLHVPWVS
jgi:hypothetical protein